jgi:hypothetical protein
MRSPLFRLLTTALLMAAVAGCADDAPPAAVDDGSGFELQILPLPEGTNCSGTGEAESRSVYRIKVLDREQVPPQTVADEEFEDGDTIKITIPESNNLEVTVLAGALADGIFEPNYFSRLEQLSLTQGEKLQVTPLLTKFADFSCVDVLPGVPNVIFPSITPLPDGRILIAGGFTQAKDGAARFEITGASDSAYIFDPADGKLRQTGNLMNKKRGAHAAVYLAKQQKVLLVGGAESLYKETDEACFPWYFDKNTAGSVGFTYELFDIKSETFFTYEGNWPDQSYEMIKKVRRVFPVALENEDGTALVTGGGQWPSCQTNMEVDPDYKVAEFYRPAGDYEGGFQDSYNGLSMKAFRTGHAGITLGVSDGLRTHLFWGGSDSGPVAELYRESSDQLTGIFGNFEEAIFLDKSSYKKKPFFHTITRLSGGQFLVLGGSHLSKGALTQPSASDAFLVQVVDEKINVNKLDGLGEGRYFHSTVTYDNSHVVVFGGFGSKVVGEDTIFSSTAMADVRFFDLGTESLSLPPVDEDFWGRAGMAGSPLSNGCIFLAGGIDSVDEGLDYGGKSPQLMAEIHCPSMLCPESLWDSTCYE